MNVSAPGISFLKLQEGARRDMYRDFVGIPTIGIGHRLTQDELSSGKLHIDGELVAWSSGLTDQQVIALKYQDLIRVERAINADGLTLTRDQFDSLASLVFNIGIGAYARSTLRKKLLLGLYADVPAQFKRWIYAAGVVSPILVKRREAEVELWNRPAVVV